MPADASPSSAADRLRVGRLAVLWAVATPLLIAATWPLWSGATDLPRVPVSALLIGAPPFLEYLLLAGVAWGSLCVLRGKRGVGFAYGGACLAGLMLLDQLRWQPWAYHLWLLGLLLLLAPPPLAVRLLRALAVSVYVYSAVAKLDYAFASTLGRQMLDATVGRVGIGTEAWPPGLLIALALSMPLAEGVIGPLLVFRRTRRTGLVLATVMHLAAVLALGPLGLGHRPGVLLWNLVFLTHLWVLFGAIGRRDEAASTEAPRAWTQWAALALILLAMLGPLTRPLGWWDRWPSWGLYAPGGERTEVSVHRSVVDRLPLSLPIEEADRQADWRRLRLDEWSLNESWAPLYPQRRTTLGIALGLHDEARLGDFLRVDLHGPADRFTGERQTETLLGAKTIEEYASRYWLNTRTIWQR